MRHEHGELCWICELPMLFRGRFLSHLPLSHDVRASLDHVVPRFKKGQTVSENLKLAHRYCNLIRGVQEIDDAMRQRCKSRIVYRNPEVMAELIIKHRQIQRNSKWASNPAPSNSYAK